MEGGGRGVIFGSFSCYVRSRGGGEGWREGEKAWPEGATGVRRDRARARV